MHVTRRNFLKGTASASLISMMPAISVSAARNQLIPSESHRVMSCNIRVALDEDETKGVGWSSRKEVCLKVIEHQQPDIIALQEVLKSQADDFRHHFSNYQLFGFDGPEMDAHLTGYHGIAKNPILFSSVRYELQTGGTYWLSETPLLAGSKSWETARARHANWVRLRDKQTDKVFRVVNLHLDHVSEVAKIQQAKMVVEESAQYQPDFPQVLTGDFNTRYDSSVFDSVRSSGWKETYETIHGEGEAGYTGHAFEGKNYANGAKTGRIDFIWYRGNAQPSTASIVKDDIGGVYPSDHYFMSADITLV